MTNSTPNYRAILVGNSYFPNDEHNLPKLNGPAHDLALMRRTLTDPTFGLFDDDQVIDLLDRDRTEVERELERFFMSCGPEDHVFLYYSGHGVLSRNDRLYFCTRDTRLDYLVTSAISDNQIKAMLDSSPARRFAIVLDCCNAGTFSSKGVLVPEVLRGPGQHLLTSTQRRQSAADAATGDDEPSPFTKYFCEGIASGTLDRNVDGFVTLHELYLYVREKLDRATQQRPLYHPGTDGDIAIARTPVRSGRDTPIDLSIVDRPILSLSTSVIEISNVLEGEVLSPESVEVHNVGGGQLDWEATCDASWVELDRSDSKIYLHLRPEVGMNRAVVSVRDKGRGGAQSVRLSVRMVAGNETSKPPRLVLSTNAVDFGVVSVGAAQPRTTVELRNLGDGELSSRIVQADDWLHCTLYGETLSIALDTSVARSSEGEVQLWTQGGTARVLVTATVEAGPVLQVEPVEIDFGEVKAGDRVERTLRVVNSGSGDLRWRSGQSGSFFSVARNDEGLQLTLLADATGDLRGTVWIDSDGGSRTVDVQARIVDAVAEKRQWNLRRPALIGGAAVSGIAVLTVLGLLASTIFASDPTAKPLPADRIFAMVKPATVMVQTHLKATVTVPRPELDEDAVYEAGEELLRTRYFSSEAEFIAARMDLIREDPLEYFVPDRSAGVRSTVVEFDGLGSGFVVTPDGYVLTNAHVVDPSKEEVTKTIAKDGLATFVREDIETLAGLDSASSAQTELLATALATFNAHYLQIGDPQKDVSVHMNVKASESADVLRGKDVEIAAVGETTPGKDVAVLKVNGVDNLPTMPIGEDSTVDPGDSVLVVGYPGDVLFHPALNPDSISEPTLTSGKLSGRQEMSKGWTAQQFENAISPGSSGSPILNDAGEAVGIATFGSLDPASDSEKPQMTAGHNFGVPMGVVREFLGRMNVTPTESPFTTSYLKGLERFEDHHYKAALSSFRDANELYGGNKDVERYIAESQQQIALGKDESGVSWTVRIGTALTALMAIVLLAFIVVRVRRRNAGTAVVTDATSSPDARAASASAYVAQPGEASGQDRLIDLTGSGDGATASQGEHEDSISR